MFTACLLGSYLETASLSHFTAAVKMQVILSDLLLLPPLTCIKSKTFKFLFIFLILIVNTLFTSRIYASVYTCAFCQLCLDIILPVLL